jgi:hypothetical protein
MCLSERICTFVPVQQANGGLRYLMSPKPMVQKIVLMKYIERMYLSERPSVVSGLMPSDSRYALKI